MLRACIASLAACSLGTLAVPAHPVAAFAEAPNQPPSYAMTPSAPSDIFVQGKFNKSGIYVPPHYEAKPKPEFHGYFNTKETTMKHGYFDTPKPKKPKHPDSTDSTDPANTN